MGSREVRGAWGYGGGRGVWGEGRLTKCSSPWNLWCCPRSPCWLRGWQSHGAARPTRQNGCLCQGSSGPQHTAYTTGPSCPETPRLCKRRLEHRAGTRVGGEAAATQEKWVGCVYPRGRSRGWRPGSFPH